MASRADRRILMTGTPAPHSPLDLYGQMRIIEPEWKPRTVDVFKDRYALYENEHVPQQITGWQNLNDLQRRIAPYKYSITLDEVLDIPVGYDSTVNISLSLSGRKAYNELREDYVTQVAQGEISTFNVLTRTLRLQQLTSGVLDVEGKRYRVDDAKPQALLRLLQEGEPEPTVVFARFKADLDVIHWAAEEAGLGSAELSGRAKDLETWQDSSGRPYVLAAQIQAGGLGVNMTRAARCIFYSTGYGAGDYWQCRARVRRAGQTRETYFTHLVAKNTIDEIALKAIRDRTSVAKALLREIK